MASLSTPESAVVTVLNLKGGVGKTHVCWLLAAACQEQQIRFLGFDTDTQANFTNTFFDPGDKRSGVDTLFNPAEDADALLLTQPTDFSHIEIVPSSADLARFDHSNQKTWEASDLHLGLREHIDKLRPHYPFIVFDCPPRLSLVSFAALCASDFVIVPMEAADWGAQGIMQVTSAIEYVQKRFNPDLKLLGYLVSRFRKARAYQQSYLKQLRSHFGDNAFTIVLPDRARFEQSVADRVPITLHSPRSHEADIARAFFAEVTDRISRFRGSGRQSHVPVPGHALA